MLGVSLKCRVMCIAVAMASMAQAVSAATLFVDAGVVGTNDCTSWLNACTDLQQALSTATAGDEIWVAQGTYRPDQGTGDRKAAFQLITGVSIFGGFPAGGGDGTFNAKDHRSFETILSGDLSGDDGPAFSNNTENTHNILLGLGVDNSAILDGFTISGGNADAAFGGALSTGGGLRNDNGSPTVRHCSFIGNNADFGGAAYNNDSSPSFINCIFAGNRAIFGGAMNNQSLVAGASVPTLINCLFHDNSANLGGAVVNFNGSSPIVTNCTFSLNTSLSDGGGFANIDGSPVFTNCIFWNNTDSSGATVAGQIHTTSGTPTVNYSCIQGVWSGLGANNISTDPMFVAPGSGDFHLLSGSPSIDSGDDTAVTQAIDLDEITRILGAAVDMGAYEFLSSPPGIVASTPSDGYIDPRCSSCSNGATGITLIEVTFSAVVQNTDGSPLSETAFTVTSTGVSPPTVLSIDASANPIVAITLSGPIEVSEWTTIQANVETATGEQSMLPIDIGFLPGDTSQSGNVNISDASAFVSEFNGAKRLELIDLNRSGNVNISDASAFVAIFNGGASGTALPVRP